MGGASSWSTGALGELLITHSIPTGACGDTLVTSRHFLALTRLDTILPMFKTWTASAKELPALARAVEGHLNEFAEEVISVSYAIAGAEHHVLVVYRPVELELDATLEAAVSVAEDIVESASP